MHIRYVALLSFALLSACGSCDSDPAVTTDAGSDLSTDDVTDSGERAASCPVHPYSGTVGSWSVEVLIDGTWIVSHASGPRVEGLPSCGSGIPARKGAGEPQVRESFANFDIDISAVDWTSLNGPLAVEERGDSVAMVWESGDTLTFAPAEHDSLHIGLDSPGATAGELGWKCDDDEAFFGLGAQVAGMDLRGRTYPLWVQEQGNGKNETRAGFPISSIIEASYAPMGVLYSSAGYTALIGHDAYSEWDLCNEADPVAADRNVRLRSYPEMPSMVLVPGERPRDRLSAVTEFTGRLPTRPPDWVFGFWVNAVEGPARVEDVASTMRDEAIPVSAIWAEDWAGSTPATGGFRLTYEWAWDPQTYPDLPATIADLNDRGFAVLGYFNPFVPNTVAHYEEGRDASYLIEDEAGDTVMFLDPAFREASLVDLSKPEAVDWLQEFQVTAIDDIGLSGWMADFAEWWPLNAVPSTESGDAWRFHNLYPLHWQRANRESFEASGADEWAYFARSGWASVNGGSSGIAPTMWGGDQDTDWDYDDGFPTIIPIGTHLGLAGISIFGSDIAGYTSLSAPNTNKELYFRWSAAGALHPLMRTHHGGGKCDNWTFDQDAETLDHTRRWASIHTLLLPYWSTMLDESMETGWPITRHPYLVAPNASAMWSTDQYQWFVGDALLVAPVITEGATTRDVTFPEDGWWPMLGDGPVNASAIPGGFTATVEAPVTELPVFVRPGTALILLAEPVDSLFGATSQGVTDLDDVADRYRVALYPTEDGVAGGGAGGVLVAADGLALPVSFVGATFDGEALPACTGNAESCQDGDRLLMRGVTTGEVAIGTTTVDIQADRPVDLEIAVGGAAFGTLADLPASPNLEAMPENWCERLGL